MKKFDDKGNETEYWVLHTLKVIRHFITKTLDKMNNIEYILRKDPQLKVSVDSIMLKVENNQYPDESGEFLIENVSTV